MNNTLDYKIAFIVLLGILGIIVILPFVCFYILTKMRNTNFCYKQHNRIANLPENNLPV